jgi:hypothetical protein
LISRRFCPLSPAGLAKNEFMGYRYGNPIINFKTSGRELVSADKYPLSVYDSFGLRTND